MILSLSVTIGPFMECQNTNGGLGGGVNMSVTIKLPGCMLTRPHQNISRTLNNELNFVILIRYYFQHLGIAKRHLQLYSRIVL